MKKINYLIIITMFVVLFSTNVLSYECTDTYESKTIIELSGKELTFICETNDKSLAYKKLNEQVVEGCFVSQNFGDNTYLVFCPVTNAE